MGYDFGDSPRKSVITHAQAFGSHRGFKLVAGMDSNPQARKRFEKKFKAPAFKTVEEMLIETKPEVVSICAPTSAHKSVFDVIIRTCRSNKIPLKAIICEKPLAFDANDAEDMVAQAKADSVLLVVNFMRRFEPGVKEVKKLIHKKNLGEIYKATVWYSKGLHNSASHLIDLFRFWFGEASNVEVISKGRKWSGEDPEPDFKVQFGGIEAYFLSAREECFSYSEIDIFGTKGKLHYTSATGEITFQAAIKDPVHGKWGYRNLEKKEKKLKNLSAFYQKHLLDSLVKALNKGKEIDSDGYSALKSSMVIDQIIQKL